MPVLMIMMLFSCKKEHSNTQPLSTDKHKYAVTFNVNTFTQQVVSSNGKLTTNKLSVNTTPNWAVFDSVYYTVFDSTKKIIKHKSFSGSTFNSGSIADSLIKGNYTIAIYAGGVGFIPNINTGIVGFTGAYYGRPEYSGDDINPTNFWKDTFGKTFNLAVTGPVANQSVTLERIVGRVDIKFTDNMPNNATSIGITYLNREPAMYNMNTGAVDTFYSIFDYLPTTYTIPDSVKNKPNYVFSLITPNTVSPFSFTISCAGSSHTFTNISVQKNQDLVLSGAFFGSVSNAWQIQVNPVWGNTTIVPF